MFSGCQNTRPVFAKATLTWMELEIVQFEFQRLHYFSSFIVRRWAERHRATKWT